MNIAVEKDLTNVSDYLSRQGFAVKRVDFSQKNAKDFIDGFDAVVVSGMDNNIMGIQDTVSAASIIEAKGMTPREIQMEIERRLQ